jgi:predicted transcriptional regulator
MTVTIRLEPETERRLKEKAAARGQTLEAYLERLAEREASAGNGTAAPEESGADSSRDDWNRQWRSWAEGHARLPAVADDSREGIYAGRGE